MRIALFTETYLPHINGVVTHVKILRDGLVQLGLLERRTDPDNRRTVHLKLTDKALPAVQEGAACQDRFFRLLLQGISSDEMETVLRLFSQIHDNVRKGLGGL